MPVVLLILAFTSCLLSVPCCAFAQSRELPQVLMSSGHSGGTITVAFSPDSRWLVTGGLDGAIKLWDVASGQIIRVMLGHSQQLTSVTVSADGRHIVSTGRDKTLKIWDPLTGRFLNSTLCCSEGNTFNVFSRAVLSRDGKTAYADVMGAVVKFDLQTGSYSKVVENLNTITAFTLSPDKRMIAVLHDENTQDRKFPIKLIDVQNRQVKKTFEGHLDTGASIDFSPDGLWLASFANDGSAKIWDVRSGSLAHTLRKPAERYINSGKIAFSPNGKVVVSAHATGIQLWDVSTGRLLQDRDDIKFGVALAFSKDARLLAVGTYSGDVRIVDLASTSPQDKTIGARNADYGLVSVVAVSDEEVLYQGYKRRSLWSTSSGQRIRDDGPPLGTHFVRALGLDTKGQLLAYATSTQKPSNVIELWNLTTNTRLASVDWGYHIAQGNFWHVAVSPDGRLLAAGHSADRQVIKLWDASTGALVQQVRPPAGRDITSAAFSRDSKFLLWGSQYFRHAAQGRPLRRCNEYDSFPGVQQTRH